MIIESDQRSSFSNFEKKNQYSSEHFISYDSWDLLRSSWAVAAYDIITSVKVESQDGSQISLNVKFTFVFIL